jgi:hypothetical protein
VLAVQLAGAELHVLLDETVITIEELAARGAFEFRRIAPSLEDLFIALVSKDEAARAA